MKCELGRIQISDCNKFRIKVNYVAFSLSRAKLQFRHPHTQRVCQQKASFHRKVQFCRVPEIIYAGAAFGRMETDDSRKAKITGECQGTQALVCPTVTA